jgi:hypothetical protein
VARAATSGRVVIVGASAGQGHDGAARELARRLVAVGMDVAAHDYLDALPAAARHALRDLYAPTVQYLPAVFDGLIRGLERPGPPAAARRLDEHAGPAPDGALGHRRRRRGVHVPAGQARPWVACAGRGVARRSCTSLAK